MVTYSYTTAALLEAELRATTVFSSSTIPSLAQATTWITEESAQINHDLGYAVGSTQYTDLYDYNGLYDDKIFLKVAPVITVDTVLYNTSRLGSTDYSTSWVSKTEDTDFTVYKDKGTLVPLPGFAPQDGMKKFNITYTAGYATVPEVVQKLATKLVAQRVLNTLIQNNINDGNDGGSISVGSINIVEPASYGVNSYAELGKDIMDLRKRLTDGFSISRFIDY